MTLAERTAGGKVALAIVVAAGLFAFAIGVALLENVAFLVAGAVIDTAVGVHVAGAIARAIHVNQALHAHAVITDSAALKQNAVSVGRADVGNDAHWRR